MKFVFGREIEEDALYLRNDELQISRFLGGHEKIIAACAPRRVGKTSFLKRIARLANKQDLQSIYLTFELGNASIFQQISKTLQRDVSSVSHLANCLDELNSPIFFLVDEPQVGTFSNSDKSSAEISKRLLRLLARMAKQSGPVHLAVAETPLFYNLCKKQGSGLEDLNSMGLKRLPAVEPVAKETFLSAYSNELLEVAGLVGNVPMEIMGLCKVFHDLSETIDSEDEFTLALHQDLTETFYPSVFETLPKEQQTVMKLLTLEPIHFDRLSDMGLAAASRLGMTRGYGFIKKDIDGTLKIASSIFEGYIRTLHTPNAEDSAKVLKNVPSSIQPALSGPIPTFANEFVIHQIGDLHFGCHGSKVDDKKHRSYSYLEHLQGLGPEYRPHVIVICGDLASTGSANEMNEAGTFLKELRERKIRGTNIPVLRPLYEGEDPHWEKQIIIVPGNHDCSWSEAEMKDPFCSFKDNRHIQDHVNPLSENFIPAVTFHEPGISFIALNSAHFNGSMFSMEPVVKPSSNRLQDEYNGVERSIMDAFHEINKWIGTNLSKPDMQDADIAFLMDAAVRFTSGYIAQKDLDEMESHLQQAEKCDSNCLRSSFPPPPRVRIAICHHNMSEYHDTTLFNDLVNSPRVRAALENNSIDILLHGHKHRPKVSTEIIHECLNRQFHQIGAGSLTSLCGPVGRFAAPSFNEIRIQCNVKEGQDVNERSVNVIIWRLYEETHTRTLWGKNDVAGLTIKQVNFDG